MDYYRDILIIFRKNGIRFIREAEGKTDIHNMHKNDNIMDIKSMQCIRLECNALKYNAIRFLISIYDTRRSGRYAPILLAPAEGWGALRPLFSRRRFKTKHTQFSVKIG